MSDVTLHIPDDLAKRLAGREHQIREILELGLRELSADPGFPGVARCWSYSRRSPTRGRSSTFVPLNNSNNE